MSVDEGFWAWLDLSRTYAGVARHLERQLRPLGLTLAYAEVLVRLGQAPQGQLRVVELGQKVFLTKSGVSQLVTRMMAAGLLQRLPDHHDQRARIVTPTHAGWAKLVAAVPVFQATVLENFTAALDERALSDMRRALGAVISALGEEPESTVVPRPGGTNASEDPRMAVPPTRSTP